jgi:hypothetical protein
VKHRSGRKHAPAELREGNRIARFQTASVNTLANLFNECCHLTAAHGVISINQLMELNLRQVIASSLAAPLSGFGELF